jgi:hypothetical protein
LFTIHTYTATLADVCENTSWRHNLRGWLATAPPTWIDYKGMTPYIEVLMSYLDMIS